MTSHGGGGRPTTQRGRWRSMPWGPLAALTLVLYAALRLWTSPEPVFLGSAGAEVYGHAWVQGWVADAWPAVPGQISLLNPPDATPWRVIDPAVTWFVAGCAQVLGPVSAYNLAILLGILGAFGGGWFLARRVGGDPWVGAVGLAIAPSFLGSAASGLTEDLALGLLAVALALVGGRGWRRMLGAGLALGALAWVGLYLALMGGIAAVILGIAAVIRERGSWRFVAGAAVIAILVALPAVGIQGSRLDGTGHRGGAAPERPEPHWRVNPHRGADLASLVVPGPDPVDDDALIRLHPAYLGFVLLGLAAAAGRRGGGWWAVLVAALVLLPGPALRVAGVATGLSDPVVVGLSRLPLLGLVNHWGRFALLAHLALVALASVGAARLKERWAWVRWAPAAIFAEVAIASPAPLPLPVASAVVPEIFESLGTLPAGAVVVVPSAGPGIQHQRPMYLQRGHGRPLMAHPNRPGYGKADRVPLVQWFASLPGERKSPPDPAVSFSLDRLAALGVGAIVVETPYVADVEAVLGAPSVRASGGAAWGVER